MLLNEHLDLIKKKYNLESTYNSYISTSLVNTFFKESFYWGLLYFNDIVQDNPENIIKYITLLLSIFVIKLPMTRLNQYYKGLLGRGIKEANFKFFQKHLENQNKKIIKTDFIEFHGVIDHVNDFIDDYLGSLKEKNDIYLRFISFYFISKKINLYLVGSLFFTFFLITKKLYEYKYLEEQVLQKQLIKLETEVRNYFITSKTLMMNNQFNISYYHQKLKETEEIRSEIKRLESNLDFKLNSLIVGIVLTIVMYQREKITGSTFFYYFLMVYDIEYIADKIMDYYKDKAMFASLESKLSYLYNIINNINHITDNNNEVKELETLENLNLDDTDTEDDIEDDSSEEENNKITRKKKKDNSDTKIDKIIIKKIYNTLPKLELNNMLIINNNDHILVDGESGNGKTTFFSIFKGTLTPEVIDINYELDYLKETTFLVVQGHKEIYNGYLYDIISNYDASYNMELIKIAIEVSSLSKYKSNEYIHLEKISGGEKSRLLTARTIYLVLQNDFQILLLDEIDENLNDDLAVEMCIKIKTLFHDKIILYITHNNKVKKLFDKQILVKNGVLHQNFYSLY